MLVFELGQLFQPIDVIPEGTAECPTFKDVSEPHHSTQAIPFATTL